MSYNASDDNSATLRSRGSAIVRKKAGENPQFRTPTLKKKSLSLKVSSEAFRSREYRRKQREYFLQLKNEFEKLGEEIPLYKAKGTKTLEDDEITCLEDLKKRKSNKRGALAAKRYRDRKRKYIKQLESILMQKRGFILKEH